MSSDGPTFDTRIADAIGSSTRLFGAGFQDPNSPDWKPDPSIMLRQSVLSAVKEQRQSLLAVQLQRPDKCEAGVPPPAPKEAPPRAASVDVVNANTKSMAKLLAMALACNQTRVFNVVHTSGASETYLAGQSKIYHQITHDELTDTQLGYQPETSKLASSEIRLSAICRKASPIHRHGYARRCYDARDVPCAASHARRGLLSNICSRPPR